MAATIETTHILFHGDFNNYADEGVLFTSVWKTILRPIDRINTNLVRGELGHQTMDIILPMQFKVTSNWIQRLVDITAIKACIRLAANGGLQVEFLKIFWEELQR